MLNGDNQKSFFELKRELLDLIQRIQSVNMLATQYEPGTFARGIGNDKAYASFNQTSREVFIKTEVQGTQYEGRSARIENIEEGTLVNIIREPENQYNANNLAVQNLAGESLGNISSDVCDILSPMIDAGYLKIKNVSVSYVEPLSKRSARAKKAILYVAITMELKDIKMDNSNGSVVCVLGGDQVRMWAQKLTIYYCDIPLEHSKAIFELYNRFHNEYENTDTNFFYVGLDNLVEEILDAREKMQLNKENGEDYSVCIEAESFGEYVIKMIREYPERYGILEQYNFIDKYEDEYFNTIDKIFEEHCIDCQEYYWLDQTRVTTAEWDAETMYGFNHWYEIAELYSIDKEFPFDLKDEDVVSILGFDAFEAFADLSYGC